MTDREIFELYKEQVYYFCYYLMKNQADAEDVCQEVFVKVILADRSKVRDLKSWILRIASNECNSILKRRKTGFMKEVRNYLLSRSQDSNPVEESLSQRETKEELQGLYSKLPDKIRMVVVLRYINELTVPEISKVMNIPEGTAKSRLNKGLKLLNGMAKPQLKEMSNNESVYSKG
ncbi:RNA polymerase sigma factor [Paenibacillus sp. GCM10012306]|uniref:RNA polymerase sigma factor n=1 Tax=Paenibacillus sp. GCM10012306 TaxID=3317342 RepID=UPI0036237B0C